MTAKLGLLLGVCFLVSLVPIPVAGQNKSSGELTAAEQAAVDAAIDAEITKQDAVGVAVGIVRENKIAYLKGYGLADRERKFPVTTKTVFNWASNSKPLLALLIMLLMRDGRLDLDDDVRKFVPEFPEQKDQVIKIRHLLCHMSGIPHYGSNIVPQKAEHKSVLDYMDPVVALDKFSLSKLQFQPGEKVLYSTFGYILLSAVAQRAGQEPLNDQINKRIIKPVGMNSFQLDLPFKDQPDWAVGYLKKGKDIVKAPDIDHFWKHGGGAYKSNIEDFTRWAEALLTRKLISKQLEDRMWEPQITNNGTKTTRGLGVIVDQLNGKLRVSHGGAQEETKTHLVIYPEDRRGIVVMCNCRHAVPNGFVNAVIGALTKKK